MKAINLNIVNSKWLTAKFVAIRDKIFSYLGDKDSNRKLWQSLIGINISQWATYSDIIIGLLVSSFFINILALAFPMSLLQVYDRIIPNKSIDTLHVIFLGIVAILIIETLLRILRAKVAAWMDSRLSYKATLHAFEHLLFSDIKEYSKDGPGVHMERINNLDTLKDFYGGQMIVTLVDLPFLFVFLALIAYIGHALVFVSITMIILLTITIIYSTRAAKEYSKEQSTANKIKLNFLVEMLSGITTIKSLAMEEQIIRRHERLQDSRTKQSVKNTYKQAEINRVISLYSQANMIITVGIGVLFVIDGSITMGGISACTLLAGRSIQPVGKVMNLWNKFQTIYLASEGHNKILSIAQENYTSSKLPVLSGYLCIDNVSLKYPNVADYTLKEVTLNVPYGQCIAITGSSESGKSTLMSIIAGQMIPTKGKITINGNSIYDYNLQHVRQNIGYLAQQANLFDGTILDNITLFRGGAYVDKAKYLAEQLGLQKEIEQMKNGYNTKVGSSALELISKGFKQSLIVIRALVNDPAIILFDEANSSMDINADKQLIAYLETLRGKRTVFLVSSRPSVLKIADRVYKLENGYLLQRNT